MDYLQVGNIDLDIFSPNTQKALVTLDDIPEGNISFSMDSNCEFLLSDDESSVQTLRNRIFLTNIHAMSVRKEVLL